MRLRKLLFIASIAPLIAFASSDNGALNYSCLQPENSADVYQENVLTVASLNIAHGRNDSFNQMFLGAETIQNNLISAADLLQRSGAHVVALQEADAPSRWSGNFDHMEFLGQASGLTCRAHGLHDTSRFATYGTALMSNTTLHSAGTHSFASTPPTRTKGYVRSDVHWNPDNRLEEPMTVTLISVHLDFSRSSVRSAQIQEMIEQLSTINNPLVVMGDFNAEWGDKESAVKLLAESLRLSSYDEGSQELGTYGDGKKRLDWILVSPAISFEQYWVEEEQVSDHQLVVANLAISSDP
jgi:endonuclease/exonuclease/phosphatase family metal-dependent hydrolase